MAIFKFFFKWRLCSGARGNYVDVLGGASKPAPAAPGNLFVLPKSASMPANIFVPNALGEIQSTNRRV